MFIFGGEKILVDKECIIQASNKRKILNALEKLFNISEETMFPDFDGFARLNAHDKPWIEPDAEYHKKRALELYQEGDYDGAIAAYTKVIEHEPGDAEAYNNRGAAYDEKGEYDRAIVDYDEAITLNLEYADAYYNRGDTYYIKDDYDRAIADFNKAIELNPNEPKYYFHRGLIHLLQKNWQQAKADLITAKEKGANNIVDSFHSNFSDIDTFQKKHNLQLPDDIVALLTSE